MMSSIATKEAIIKQRLKVRRLGVIIVGAGILAILALLAPQTGWLAAEVNEAEAAPPSALAAWQSGDRLPLSPDALAWRVVSSANPGTSLNDLFGVAVASAQDIWAVGYKSDGSGNQTLIEHWNGTSWSATPSPNPGSTDNELYNVVVVSASDVWAVGYKSSGSGYQTLIEHWNGSAWSVIASPNPDPNYDYLYGVAAASSTDVWAVGYTYVPGNVNSSQNLFEHWNGSAWSVVSGPGPGLDLNELSNVTVESATDAWAVGYYTNQDDFPQALIEHWNGTNWSVASNPNGGSTYNFLYGVAAASATDAWAVGYYATNGVTGQKALVEHWDGTTWTLATNPYPALYTAFKGVTVVSASDVWATGTAANVYTSSETLVEHWDGSAWSVVSSPSAMNYSTLNGVSLVSGNDLWAVGYAGPSSVGGAGSGTLVEHYSAGADPTSSPTTTPTAEPSATPTPCTGFTDVPSGSTFYPFVTCLVSRNIVSGYPDCTFHVNSNVTRGQLSKIVSLAAEYSEPSGPQMFEDVVPGSTFYLYVQRLAGHSIIGGYACGGVGEPCVAPLNRPYFRPNNNATRGQISKIVSNAAGFADAPGTQIFEDVVPGSTFYDFAQRLANRSIIGGYACGGAGEPCQPGNKPYFRPNANTTRGQTAKIVANSFFPGCATP